jgi:hypothetical protein
MPSSPGLALLFVLSALVAGCGSPDVDADAEGGTAVQAAAPEAAGPDWSRCRFPGLSLPVGGRLFVVDGGKPGPDVEPGRETIRRVDILVPGPVSLLLTAPDASVWSLRPSPETQLQAVFATGSQPQRVTGTGLARTARLERSSAMGDDCGRYWLADGTGAELANAATQVFGRRHDAVYGLRVGRVAIGEAGTEPLSVPAAGNPAPKE